MLYSEGHECCFLPFLRTAFFHLNIILISYKTLKDSKVALLVIAVITCFIIFFITFASWLLIDVLIVKTLTDKDEFIEKN